MDVITIESMIKPDNPFIRLNPKDNVVVTRIPLSAGVTVPFEGTEITIRNAIGAGHKVAVSTIPAGGAVIKYGENIGTAGEAIEPGDLIHVHNLRFGVGGREYEFSTGLQDLAGIPLVSERTFQGYPAPTDASVPAISSRSWGPATAPPSPASRSRPSSSASPSKGRGSTALLLFLTLTDAASPMGRIWTCYAAPSTASPTTRTSPRPWSWASAAR